MLKKMFVVFTTTIFLVILGSCTTELKNYSLSGTITFTLPGYPSHGLSNVAVKLQSADAGYSTMTDSAGNYSFSNVQGGFYTIIPQKTGWQFGTLGVMLDRNAKNQNFDVIGTVGAYTIDPWGYIWDNTTRAAKTYAQAVANCPPGWRLPTPTEIYRNNLATGTGAVGTLASTEWLWTNILWDQTNITLCRLSDGATTADGPTGSYNFRYVMPDAVPDAFTGSNVNVNKIKGEQPFEFATNGHRFVMDTMDRASLPYSAAMREAMFYNAFIPTLSYYTAAIKSGLPNGSNNWLFTSDQEGADKSDFIVGLVAWPDINTAFPATYSTYIAGSYLVTNRNFRCIGWKTKPAISPCISSISGTTMWTDTDTTDGTCVLKSVTNDMGGSTGTSLVEAIDACFKDGGHLPTEQELMQMIIQGLPNGSGGNNWLWSSDYETGTSSGLAGIVRWQGTQKDFTGYYSTFSSWSGHTTTDKHLYRPVYYPLDKDYSGPDQNNTITCPKGLFSYTKDLGNGNVIRIWIDNSDRDVKAFHAAIKDCYDSGGHLATRRDLVELIRKGLPNGSGNWIWTSDMANWPQAETIRWTGINNSFADQDTGTTPDGSALDTSGAPLGYRCIWTNELRIP
jgi:hypothetical protein